MRHATETASLSEALDLERAQQESLRRQAYACFDCEICLLDVKLATKSTIKIKKQNQNLQKTKSNKSKNKVQAQGLHEELRKARKASNDLERRRFCFLLAFF